MNRLLSRFPGVRDDGHLVLAESGGVVRAGVVAYIDDDDVSRLVAAVASVAGE